MAGDWTRSRGPLAIMSSRDDRSPRSSVTRPRVDLGHAWNKKPQPGAKTHVVRREGNSWVLACTGSRATREYPGYAEQATCSTCRKVEQS